MIHAKVLPENIFGGGLLVLVLILSWTTVCAADFYVIPVGKKATGDATADDVLKGKTFSNSSATGLTGRMPPAPVEKTGQKQQSLSGDDGDLQRGVSWPDPRFSAGTYVVTDHLTGLMWQKSLNTSFMSWYSAIPYCNNLVLWSGGPIGSYLDDWRLPNIKELQSLIDYGKRHPALPDNHPFTGLLSDYYWSSTTCAIPYDYIHAWVVYFYNGQLHDLLKSDAGRRVWCVRGGN